MYILEGAIPIHARGSVQDPGSCRLNARSRKVRLRRILLSLLPNGTHPLFTRQKMQPGQSVALESVYMCSFVPGRQEILFGYYIYE